MFGHQVFSKREVSTSVVKLWWSDEDLNTVSLLCQDPFAPAKRRRRSTSFSLQCVETHSVYSAFK